MSALRNVRMLTRYAAWANSLLYSTISGLPKIELTKNQPIVFGNLLRTMNHVMVMDVVWQANLLGRPHGFKTRNPEEPPEFGALRAAQALLDEWYIRYAEQMSDASADEIVDFTLIGGNLGSMSRSEILLHVVNHTTYHRGHVADMLYQIPAKPPATDLPVFLRESRGAE